MLKEKYVCCICGKIEEGYGNDPWPLSEKGKCCDECNFEKVVPARITMLRAEEEQVIDLCVEFTCFNNVDGKCLSHSKDANSKLGNKCKAFSED